MSQVTWERCSGKSVDLTKDSVLSREPRCVDRMPHVLLLPVVPLLVMSIVTWLITGAWWRTWQDRRPAGFRRRARTFRRVLALLDAQAVAATFGSWLAI